MSVGVFYFDFFLPQNLIRSDEPLLPITCGYTHVLLTNLFAINYNVKFVKNLKR